MLSSSSTALQSQPLTWISLIWNHGPLTQIVIQLGYPFHWPTTNIPKIHTLFTHLWHIPLLEKPGYWPLTLIFYLLLPICLILWPLSRSVCQYLHCENLTLSLVFLLADDNKLKWPPGFSMHVFQNYYKLWFDKWYENDRWWFYFGYILFQNSFLKSSKAVIWNENNRWIFYSIFTLKFKGELINQQTGNGNINDTKSKTRLVFICF